MGKITTEAEFTKLRVSTFDRLREIAAKATKEHWPDEKTLEAMEKVYLPFAKKTWGADNPATAFTTKDFIQNSQGKARVLNPTEQPALMQVIKEEIAKLNVMKDKQFGIPRVIVENGEQGFAGLVYSHDKDALMVDAKFLRDGITPQNIEVIKAAMGHELDHRYQVSHKQFETVAKVSLYNWAGKRTTEAMDLASRQMEAEADYTGAVLSSPKAAKAFLTQALNESPLFFYEYIKERNHLEILVDAYDAYNNANDAEKEKLSQEFVNVSKNPKKMAQLKANFFKEDADPKRENKQDHPGFANRFKLMDSLEANPDLMLCKNVKFDGHATIVSADHCTLPNKPALPKVRQ